MYLMLPWYIPLKATGLKLLIWIVNLYIYIFALIYIANNIPELQFLFNCPILIFTLIPVKYICELLIRFTGRLPILFSLLNQQYPEYSAYGK
jgi:hypothetical protein